LDSWEKGEALINYNPLRNATMLDFIQPAAVIKSRKTREARSQLAQEGLTSRSNLSD
jgi:hypothetical protein